MIMSKIEMAWERKVNLFIYSVCEAKDSQKSEFNYYTSQKPNGEKTREEV